MALMHWMALTLSALVAPRTSPQPEVVWIDLAGVSAATQEAARREAEAVLEDVGLSPRWRVGAASDMVGPRELPVVLLQRDLSARRGSSRVLGACIPRASSPRAWVYLENLAWAMGLPAFDEPLSIEQ